MKKNSKTKLHIIQKIAKDFDLTLAVAEQAVSAFFDNLSIALICGDRVELRGFGSMIVRKRSNKILRNPKTKEKVEVGNKGSLYFRPSRELTKRLNGI